MEILGITKMFKKLDKDVIKGLQLAVGKPYKYNCFDLSGFDCYTLIYYLYNLNGVELPKENIAKYNLKVHRRVIKEHLHKFSIVKFSDREAFDILLFESSSNINAHLGLMLNRTHFIHANLDQTVKIEPVEANILMASLRKVYRWKFIE